MLAGAVHDTVACALPPTAVIDMGKLGFVAGVTDTDADAELVPAPFVAVTVNVYDVPFVRPVTTMGDDAPDTSIPAGDDDTTLYLVIAEPPLDAGAVKETVACPFPLVAVPIVGAPGAVASNTDPVVATGPSPTEFCAVTVNVYVVPVTTPLTSVAIVLKLSVDAE